MILSKNTPHPFPFDTETWGEIYNWEPVLPGIYYINTIHDPAYVLVHNECQGTISDRALKYGVPYADSKCTFFNRDHGRDIIEYEVCKEKLKEDPENKELQDDLKSIFVYGGLDYYDYFGKWEPQKETPWGPLTDYIEADYGVWFIKANNKWYFSLHYVLADLMDPIFTIGAEGNPGEYPNLTYEDVYWPIEKCAPPLYGILEEAPGLNNYITSMDDLSFCLCTLYPKIAEWMNYQIDRLIEVQKRLKANQEDINMWEVGRLIIKPGAKSDFLKLPFQV